MDQIQKCMDKIQKAKDKDMSSVTCGFKREEHVNTVVKQNRDMCANFQHGLHLIASNPILSDQEKSVVFHWDSLPSSTILKHVLCDLYS